MKVHDQQPRVEQGHDYGPAPEYGSPYPQGRAAPRTKSGSAYERDARRIIEAKQVLRKAQISIAPSRSIITPCVFRAEAASWYAEQEESSHPQHSEHGRSERPNPLRDRFTRKEKTEVHIQPSHRNLSKRLGHGADWRPGVTSKHPDMPLMLEVGPVHPTVLKIGNSSERGALCTFATPLSRKILKAPRLSKVKMPSIELFDRTTDLDKHLDVYKAQMYVQDVDDVTCCQYFPATLKGIAKKWFNGLPNGSIASFFQLAKLFSAHFITNKRGKKTSIHLATIWQQRGEDLKDYI